MLDTVMWVGRQVPERTSDRQHPIVKVSNLEDNLALAYYAACSKEPIKLDWAVDVPTVMPGLDPVPVASWQRMLDSYREGLMLGDERIRQVDGHSSPVGPQQTTR